MNEQDLVVVRTFPSDNAARMVSAYLGAEGIEVCLSSDSADALHSATETLTGVRLLVNHADAERAGKLLASIDATEAPPGTPSGELIAKGRNALLLLLVSIAISVFFIMRDQQRRSFTGTKPGNYNSAGKPTTWRHYQSGHLVSAERDRNGDGNPDEWYHYERDVIVRTEADNDFDGNVDAWWTFQNGIVASYEADTDGDGVPDFHVTFVNGVSATEDWYAKTGKVFRHVSFSRNGKRQELIDEGGDGWFDKRITYDALERPVLTQTIHDEVRFAPRHVNTSALLFPPVVPLPQSPTTER